LGRREAALVDADARKRIDSPAPEPEGSSVSEEGHLRHNIVSTVLAIGIALLVRAMLFETYYVPSESMLPTLLIGDHMLVNKYAFGARVPFTNYRLPARREPVRGDVVTFTLGRDEFGQICPVDRCPDYPVEGFVKRIIGLPGDTIEVKGDRVYLNDEPLPVEFDAGVFLDDAGNRLRMGTEVLDGRNRPVLDDPRYGGLTQVRIKVPEGRYFMLGDNRDNSNDSRGWGTVARAELKGPVTRIYWSWNNQGSWASMLNPLTWWYLLRDEMRWDRVGLAVE
jgi:signal peptidase I